MTSCCVSHYPCSCWVWDVPRVRVVVGWHLRAWKSAYLPTRLEVFQSFHDQYAQIGAYWLNISLFFYHVSPVYSAPATLASLLPCAKDLCFLCVDALIHVTQPLTPSELCSNFTFSEKPILTTRASPTLYPHCQYCSPQFFQQSDMPYVDLFGFYCLPSPQEGRGFALLCT